MSDKKDLSEHLTAYLDQELSELDRQRVEQALQNDPALAALEQQLRQAVAAMPRLEHPQPSAALRRAVLNRLDEPWGWKGRLARLFTVPALASLAAAAVVLVVAAAVVARTGPERPLADDPELLVVAQNLEVLEDLDVVGLDSADDLDVVASLHELEVTP